MLRYIYFGTPEISKNVLEGLVNKYSKPVLVVTNVDRKTGRGLKITPSPVKEFAQKNNIPILQPEKLIEIKDIIKSYNIDVAILFAYGKIIPEWLINSFNYGIINVHPSLLPLYRGSTPLTGPILNGDNLTGVTIMDMDKELDHGDIYIQNEFKLHKQTNRIDIENFVIQTAPDLLIKVMNDLDNNCAIKNPQNHEKATYTSKIKKEDGEILDTDTDEIKYRKYKAFIGWPGVYFFKDNKRIKITKADFIDDKFIIEKVIPEGGKEIDFNLFLKNHFQI